MDGWMEGGREREGGREGAPYKLHPKSEQTNKIIISSNKQSSDTNSSTLSDTTCHCQEEIPFQSALVSFSLGVFSARLLFE